MKKCFIVVLTLLMFTSFKEKELTWVAIGDSITYLNDHPNETGDRVTKGYLSSVCEQLPNIRYINQGHNGWTSGGIADNIEKLGLIKADVYSVFLGTNDWWAGRPLGKIENYSNADGNSTVYGSFRIIINKIRQLNPDAKIVLITPMQRNDFVYIADPNNNAYGSYKERKGQWLEQFANAIVAIAKHENIPVVDLYHNPELKMEDLVNFKRLKSPESGNYVNYAYPASIRISFNPKTDDYPYPPAAIKLTYDGLHPSDAGNAIIARAVVKAFTTLGLAPRWKQFIDIESYNKPFWKADTITDESIQLIKDGDRTSAKLLFKAKKIISIKSTDQSKVFKKGAEWNYIKGVITAKKGADMPFIKKEDLVFHTQKPGLSMTGKAPGTFVLFNENAYFSARQLLVTYVPDSNSKWGGPVSAYDPEALPGTIAKLTTRNALNVVFYGNSIETGYNASGFMDVAPFMPSWPELMIYKLRSTYTGPINYINTSIPGKLAKWGVDSVASRVVAHQPDLVVLGFGMNDGSSRVAPAAFREQLDQIMQTVKASNSNAEFILIAPMLPNLDAVQSGLQAEYKAELEKLVKPGVALVNMTGVHAELLKHKSYQDMTGNNVNHPNDYLARWYAQVVAGLLTK